MADRKRDDHVDPTKKDGPRDDVAEHLRAILWKDGERDDRRAARRPPRSGMVPQVAGLIRVLTTADDACVDGGLRAMELAMEKEGTEPHPDLVTALTRLFHHNDARCRERASRRRRLTD